MEIIRNGCRKRYYFYSQFVPIIDKVPEEYRIEFRMAIENYALRGVIPDFGDKVILQFAWGSLVEKLNEDIILFCNGMKGGRPRKPSENQARTNSKPKINNLHIISNNNINKEERNKKEESSTVESRDSRFIEFQEKLKKYAPHVAEMQDQMSEEQFFEVLELFNYDGDKIIKAIEKMENSVKCTTSNRSVFLTIKTWKERGFFNNL